MRLLSEYAESLGRIRIHDLAVKSENAVFVWHHTKARVCGSFNSVMWLLQGTAFVLLGRSDLHLRVEVSYTATFRVVVARLQVRPSLPSHTLPHTAAFFSGITFRGLAVAGVMRK